MKGWRYYNHAMLPTSEPHEEVDLEPIRNKSIWKIPEKPLMARWTSDFNCGYETNWWYVIKDTPFDIASLKSKRRYEVNKGKKNFTVKRIDPEKYLEELLKVQIAAYSVWPEKYRPTVDEKAFKESAMKWKDVIVYAGFSNETAECCAYTLLNEYPGHLEFNVLRANPDIERYGINAAMVNKILEDYSDRLGNRFYINDGERSIRHETAFQDYLEKYFGFRKAYCKLNIRYRLFVRLIINVLYPFRNIINKENKFGSLIVSVLRMEEIRRCQ